MYIVREVGVCGLGWRVMRDELMIDYAVASYVRDISGEIEHVLRLTTDCLLRTFNASAQT